MAARDGTWTKSGEATGKDVVFRVDASTQIGAGHVMRCLTVADELRNRDRESRFICRDHPGHLGKLIVERGHRLELLPLTPGNARSKELHGYAAWLGDTQMGDAEATLEALAGRRPDWLIVDHYALGAEWEIELSDHCGRLMVIDDLADRAHRCDLLLDQTLGRQSAAYKPLVPAATRLLCGARFALLRPEFSNLRAKALRRRTTMKKVNQILVTLGGADADNVTGRVLAALQTTNLPSGCRVKAVIGWQSPWGHHIRRQAEDAPFAIDVLSGVDNMARLMAESDIAIGAAGSSAWERCCLGLPSIMIVLADNQKMIAEKLEASGAALVIANERLQMDLPLAVEALSDDAYGRRKLGTCAASIVDGRGVSRVADILS